MRRGAFGLSSLTTHRLAYANQYVKQFFKFSSRRSQQFLKIYEDSAQTLASSPPFVLRSGYQILPSGIVRGLFFGGMSMQAVHLSGGALTLGLAVSLLCSGCVSMPPASQNVSTSQISVASASLSQVSSLRGALDRLEPDHLILASGGKYYQFSLNGVDVSGLIPGDPVTITYTGVLDPEKGTISTVLLSIVRDTL